MLNNQRHNVVYEVETGLILKLYGSPSQCDEALSEYYSGKSADHPNDRAWGQFKFPAVCTPTDIIGTTLDSWKDPTEFLSGFHCTPRYALINPHDEMVLEILPATDVDPEDLPESVVTLLVPDTWSDLSLIGTRRSEYVTGYWITGS